MRTTLAAPLATILTLAACSSFSGTEREPPPPPVDTDAGVMGGATCDVPVVTPGDARPDTSCVGGGLALDNDPRNCGACGHSCFDARCVAGLCEPEVLGAPAVVMAIEGRTLYLAREGEVTSVALEQRGAREAAFVSGIVGSIRGAQAAGPELYVSTSSLQYVIDIGAKELGPNGRFGAVEGATPDGLFFPGNAWSHYVFGGAPEEQRIARIPAAGNIELGPRGALRTFARRGDDLFWTAPSAGGSAIFGPFERLSPIFRSSSVVHALAVGNEHAYFDDEKAQKVLRVALAPPHAAQPIAEERGRLIALAVNGEDVFYAADRVEQLTEHYVVVRVSTCGGPPVVLIDDRDPIHAIAADAEFVYALTSTRTIRARR